MCKMRRRVDGDKVSAKGPETQPIIITITKLKYIIGISIILLLIQIYIIKIFFDGMTSTEPQEVRTPWEAVKLLLKYADQVGLTLFVIESSLLRAVREGSLKRIDLWNRQPQSVVTFGVKETDIDIWHRVVKSMESKGYTFWEKQDEDPRHVISATQRAYRVISTHMLLWVPVDGYSPMLIHCVVFFERKNYMWHPAIQDRFHIPPFDMSESPFGRTAGAYSLFELAVVHIDDVRIQFPKDSSAFLKETKTAEFIECNQTQVHEFQIKYGMKKRDEIVTFQRKVRHLLSVAKNALDMLEIPFWLSSGTCLGWYRQCDVIPYTTDVDIGIFIKDYQEAIIATFENHGLMLTHSFGKVNDSLEYSFLYGDLKLDVFFFYASDKYIWNGGTQASTGNKYKYTFPKFHLCWTEFLDLLLRVPCPPLPYILANYGHSWMSPVKEWDWKQSPPNVNVNGQWPKEEWEEVIQLYE